MAACYIEAPVSGVRTLSLWRCGDECQCAHFWITQDSPIGRRTLWTGTWFWGGEGATDEIRQEVAVAAETLGVKADLTGDYKTWKGTNDE